MRRAGRVAGAAVAAACGAATLMATAPAVAAADVLLPHPGPDGLVWVPEWTGDGGVASGGASSRLPTVLTVACEGGGSLDVFMESQQHKVAGFSVNCPVGSPGVGVAAMDAGVVQPGSFTVGVDASDESVRWALTVTQPEG